MQAGRHALTAALPPGEQVEASHVLELDPSPRLVAKARDFVREHVPPLPEETVDVLLLLTSELVTNAVIHARTALEVGVTLSPSSVLVTVHDLDLHRPSQQPYADREGGWGLALVTALAEDHSIELHPEGGKTAWFRIARGGVPSVADAAAARATRRVHPPDRPTVAPGPAGRVLLGADGHEAGASVPKLETGLPGFDHVSMGGLPRRRATVVAGQAGSAKTVLAGQFLAEGVRRGQPGVFVTLEEPARDLRDNLATLGLDVAAWEEASDWRFVDASPLVRVGPDGGVSPYSMEVLTAQIGQAVDATGADRLVLDSLNAVMALHEDGALARQQLRSLIADLRGMGLTVIMTVETPGDPGTTLSRYGIEEFVADSVVLLRNTLDGKFRRRTVEVLKMRGAMHLKGEVPFTVLPGKGIVVLPILEPAQSPNAFDERITTGNEGLDRLTHGGWYRDASILASGPTGAGKTLLTTEFVASGLARGEKVLLVAYEETREQVLRNARGWGHDLTSFEEQGLLQIVALYPEVASLDDHLVALKDLVTRFEPALVAIDSLSALERVGSASSYREFVIGFTSYVKQLGVATFMTAASPSLTGGQSVTDSHISALIDSIVVLRYVEVFGEVKRGILVLKMRSSSHEHEVREFTIDDTGMHVGEPFRSVSGILTGQLVHLHDRSST